MEGRRVDLGLNWGGFGGGCFWLEKKGHVGELVGDLAG